MLDLESNEIEIIEDYDEVFEETTSKIICLVEGNNKFFYQQLEELMPYVVDDGGNCIGIIKKVEQNKKIIGVIDNDYRDKNLHLENIIKIDYYSIENIALQKITDFKPLVDALEEKSDLLGLDKLRMYDIKVEFFPSMRGNYEFNLILGRQYQERDRIRYVKSEITSVPLLIKFKNLKVAVERTSKYLNMKFQKNIQYINDLCNYVEGKSIKKILSEEEYDRFLIIDESVRK